MSPLQHQPKSDEFNQYDKHELGQIRKRGDEEPDISLQARHVVIIEIDCS